MSEHCRSCGAGVVFVPSAKTGRPMILDAKPEKRVVVGHVLESTKDHASAFIADVGGVCSHAVARIVDVFTDHHVSCPDGPAWKGRTRNDPP